MFVCLTVDATIPLLAVDYLQMMMVMMVITMTMTCAGVIHPCPALVLEHASAFTVVRSN